MPFLLPLRVETRARSNPLPRPHPEPPISSLSSARNKVVDADRGHLDGDEVLQSNVLFYQELLSFGDKAHGSQQDLLVLCQVFLILRVRYCDWDLFLWKGKKRWELGIQCSFSTGPRKRKGMFNSQLHSFWSLQPTGGRHYQALSLPVRR